jgi:ubiquinone/menaquinone biosynthesis C-methylase UbiE
MHKSDSRKRSVLDDPKRFLFENADKILSEAGVKPGEVVADIRRGTGFFTLPLAKYVGKREKVYALDTSPTMIKELRKHRKNLNKVKPICSEENRFPIQDGSLDFALLVNMTHELENWRQFLKEVYRFLKPGGRMCIVDWKKRKMEIGPPLKIRFTKKRIGEVLRQTGYSQIRSLSPLLFHNAIIGVKSITGL